MDLFNQTPDKNQNLLPYDGTVNYYGRVLSHAPAHALFHTLLETIDWQPDKLRMFGKIIVTKRKVAWYGSNPYQYTYSNATKTALPWTAALLELKTLVEQATGETFNTCLLNLYHNGEEGSSWHSDDEPDLKQHGAIASISLGAERNFLFKHKQTKEKVAILLEHGSLLLMKNETQSRWLHSLPTTRKITTPRINLTFRTIVV
ncbi:alpha-ketoglutarate-dependent dioxygenase AlkB [Chitinophaga parva]|uniref:Alpha-ketoglutarate-dependent dioxygenase AlkB n=1 Tax=Chitinophaga parva TaxID=2169414 RepID=A0A2T7BHS1_9BACT|nr:alpha-ketoglutarate-dependent dioxygenase AlkB [Chitinophaga parva]PUZ25835.1 alpha-ketoglutarate-dependent dioxygenase AlkB [Chitinophaga parva]